MAIKKSVFLSEQTANWITETTDKGEGPKWSESINATFEQFRFLMKINLPELSEDEWEIILNAYEDCHFPAHGIPARIAQHIMEDQGAISLDTLKLLKPNHATLVEKVHTMSQTEQFAILYFVQLFWSKQWPGEWSETVTAIKKLIR